MAIVKEKDRIHDVKVHDGIIKVEKPTLLLYAQIYGDDDEAEAKPNSENMVALATACIKEWPYPDVINEENVANLDGEAALEVMGFLNEVTKPMNKNRGRRARLAARSGKGPAVQDGSDSGSKTAAS